MDPLPRLPPELLTKTLRYLNAQDLVALGRVSQGWRDAARDPLLWRGVELRVPGTPPGTLHAAPCIGHLLVNVANASERHLAALLSGAAKVLRLTCVGDTTDGSRLKRLLKHCTQSKSLEDLSVLCETDGTMWQKVSTLKAICRLQRLKHLTLRAITTYRMSDNFSKYLSPSVLNRKPSLTKLRVVGPLRANICLNAIKGIIAVHKSSLRSLELPYISIWHNLMETVGECRGLTDLAFDMSYVTDCWLELLEKPSGFPELKDLKLQIDCEGLKQVARLEAALAGLQGSLQSLEVTVLCGMPTAARHAEAVALEARLRTALPHLSTAALVHCRSSEDFRCTCVHHHFFGPDGADKYYRAHDTYHDDYDNFIDVYWEKEAEEEGSWGSDSEEDDDE